MTHGGTVLEQLNRFPVKGFSAEPLDAVDLKVGEGIPGDRLFGFARFDSGFDPDNPQPLPKGRFVALANEKGRQDTYDRPCSCPVHCPPVRFIVPTSF